MKIYGKQAINPTSLQCSVRTARRDTFIFFKSNYKYKRRYQKHQYHNMTASQCRGNAIIGNISSDNSAAATECDSINEVIKDTWTRWKRQKSICNTYAALLRVLLLIISNAWKPSGGKQQQQQQQLQQKQKQQQDITKCNRKTKNDCKKVVERQLATFSAGAEAAPTEAAPAAAATSFTDDVNEIDNDEMDFQQNDVKVLKAISMATKTPPTMSSPRSSTSLTTSSSIRSIETFDAPTPLPATMMCSSAASAPTKSALSSLLPVGATCYGAPLRISDKLFTFFAALFIAFAFCARSVAAGACWQTALDTGKCNEIYSLNITRAECCGRSQEFSYTDRDLTEVEYFFATAIGGGMECSPCIESCKRIECGANKKCVKRKGRPKCICAPECGAAARRRRQQQQQEQRQQQQQQQQQLYRGHLHHSEQLPRDIRSLSSEITNFNLGLDTRGDVGANNSHRRNQNQRKTPSLPSQFNHHYRHHEEQQQRQQQPHNHYHDHNQQPQQRPSQIKASKRLVIIANVDPKEYKERLTKQRMQIVGSVAKDPKSRNSDLISSSLNKTVTATATAIATATATASMDEEIFKSRRKSNENIAKTDDNNNNGKCNEMNAEFESNKCNTENRLRHRHRKFNLNANGGDGDGDDTAAATAAIGVSQDDGSQESPQHRRRILQRERKLRRQLCRLNHNYNPNHYHNHHHLQQHHQQQQQRPSGHHDRPKEHFYQHQHEHRCKQKQKQKLKLEGQQKKQQLLRDRQQQESNKTTMSMQMLPENGATFLKPASGPSLSPSPSSSASASASSLPSKTKITIAATTASTTTAEQPRQRNLNPQTSMVNQTAAFANSATSLLSALPGRVVIADRQHSLNHGSISAASSSQSLLGHETSLSTSTSISPSPSPSPSASESPPQSQSESTAKHPENPDKIRDTDGPDASNSFQFINEFTTLDEFSDNHNLQQFSHHHHQNNGNSDFEIIRHNSHPVCGTDGRTYNTECKLKKRACRTNNQNLQVAYRGHCKTSCNGVKCLNGLTCVEDHYMMPHCISCKIDCPEDEDAAVRDSISALSKSSGRRIIIDPSRAVCGVDGKTYKSICDINRMVCKIGRSIAIAYPGPCRTDRITCSDINCGPKQTCLVDLLTHEPRCVSCRYKCARRRHPTALRYEEGKICGVNNRSYNSWCEMRKDSCNTGYFIDVKAGGQCQ